MIQTRWWASANRDMKPDLDSHMPFALLGEEGWEAMDPFLPIEVFNLHLFLGRRAGNLHTPSFPLRFLRINLLLHQRPLFWCALFCE